MAQNVGQPCDVDVRILLHTRADDNAAEADEEVDGRLSLEIAHPIADKRRLPVRTGTDVAHHKLLPAGPGKKGTMIEVFVAAVRIKHQRDGMHVSARDVQFVRKRKNGLLDTGGNEMDDYAAVPECRNGLLRTVDERTDVGRRKLLNPFTSRPDHLQTPCVYLIERDLSVHCGSGEPGDLRIAAGKHVDPLDGDESGVDVEEGEAVGHGFWVTGLLSCRNGQAEQLSNPATQKPCSSTSNHPHQIAKPLQIMIR